MSTKTTFKRVALATVAAMGFGLLSVVPASAAVGAVVWGVSNPAVTTTVGVSTAITVNLTSVAGTAADADAFTIVPTKVAAEITLAAATVGTLNTATTNGWRVAAGGTSNASLLVTENGDGTAATAAAAAGLTIGNINFTASAPGLYTITLTATNVAGATFATPTVSISINVTAGPNAGLNSFITTATTVDTPGNKTDGTATTAYAVSNTSADLAINAPGVVGRFFHPIFC